jgi:hypothetical protein
LHHKVRASDVILRALYGAFAAAADCGPKDFADLLLAPGVGANCGNPRHGGRSGARPYRVSDPALLLRVRRKGRAFVPGVFKSVRRVDHEGTLRRAQACLGNVEELGDQAPGRTSAAARGERFDEILAREQATSQDYGGRSVFGAA